MKTEDFRRIAETTEEELMDQAGLTEEEKKEFIELEKSGKLNESIGLPAKNPIEEIREKFTGTEIKRAIELISIGKTSEEDLKKFSGIDIPRMMQLIGYGEFNIRSASDINELKKSLDHIQDVADELLFRMQKEAEEMIKRNGGK